MLHRATSTTFWRYYADLLRQIEPLLKDAKGLVASAASVVTSAATATNQLWLKKIAVDWQGVSPWWSALPIGLLVIWGLLWANFKKYSEVEQQRNALEAEKQNRVDRYGVVTRLAQFRASGTTLLNELISTQRDADYWIARSDKWAEEVLVILRTKATPSDIARFETIHQFSPESAAMMGYGNKYALYRQILNERLHRLFETMRRMEESGYGD